MQAKKPKKGAGKPAPLPSIVLALKFGDEKVTVTNEEHARQLQANASRMATSDDPWMREASKAVQAEADRLKQLPSKVARFIQSSKAGKAAAGPKIERAKHSQAKAIARFDMLTASGERDAAEAMTMMESEGWSKRTLQRHLSDRLQRLGRGRRNVSRAKPARKRP